ncbi:hypothetical protein AYI72_18050 [Shewanella algae]|uniref:aromatic amino acid lyase n=1 Tax=Shewanella algae TaxID=38313 RepID=UPI000E335D6C|nr:aromatic amino acid lyase [Shewanella algae]AXQ13997.1 hypothetical protein BS332_06430 [Shewanella algae]QXP20457.1 aromatic amino acid ammonia-lyase [Shewanella algae]QXP30116.1 aromatic amino acid ammonia-lyase [Shewanella algae]QXP32899.1 aromatic amino acid ammonia-lyase [Shewanella algae]QXP39274.1 aromatic amino acid ammonia-lyase [Shewanella algae]
MSGLSNILIVSAVALPLGCASAAEVITLDGQSLKIAQLLQLKDKQVQVALSKEAQKTIHASHELLIDSARKGTPVYGLTVGVGKNNDPHR